MLYVQLIICTRTTIAGTLKSTLNLKAKLDYYQIRYFIGKYEVKDIKNIRRLK